MPWISTEIWEHLQSTLHGLQERNDRLMESIATGQKLRMPAAPIVRDETPRVLEPSSGYFDTKPVPIITNKTGGTTQ